MNFDCSKCDLHFECNATAACRCDNESVFFGVWHPYPQDKPTEHDEYIVTVKNPVAPVSIDYWSGAWRNYEDSDIVAWAELPKAYEP